MPKVRVSGMGWHKIINEDKTTCLELVVMIAWEMVFDASNSYVTRVSYNRQDNEYTHTHTHLYLYNVLELESLESH